MKRRDFKKLAGAVVAAAAMAAIARPTRARESGKISPMIDTKKIVSADFQVPSGAESITLFVRNKRRKDVAPGNPQRTLLFLHGGSQSSEATFDLRLDGFSWADYIASHGWDVWLMDLTGFGGSSKPQAMSMPPQEAPAVGRLDTQIADLGAVVSHICRERKIPSVNILAWSWGSAVTAFWAAAHPETVGRIALFGPPWSVQDFPPGVLAILNSTMPLPGYDAWTTDDTWKRFKTGIPAGVTDDLTLPGWRAAWEAATLATDPQAHDHNPPRVRSPLGQVLDMRERVRAGQVMYPAADVQSPVLIAVGEWDGLATPKSALALYGALARAPERQMVVLGHATHVAHLERHRLKLFSAVQAFLENR